MSYYFALSFKEVENREQAMNLGVRFARMVAQSPHADRLIRDNIRWAAVHCKGGDDSSKYLRGWLCELFKVRLLYWPEHKLAAIVGDTWPEQCMTEFGLQSHEFQNSCDQDYELDSWPDMELFRKEQEKVETAEFKDAEDEEYSRRSALYENIFAALDLDAWVYEHPTEKFEQMAFSGIYQMSQMVMLSLKAKAALNMWEDGMKRLIEDIKNGAQNA